LTLQPDSPPTGGLSRVAPRCPCATPPTAASSVGGWPAYRAANAPCDTDGDGIPDDWERAHGLNPRDPRDASRDSGDGYTWIEKYINGIR